VSRNAESAKPPWTVKVSSRVSVRYGYKDARVEVGITIAGMTKWLPFDGSELGLAESVFVQAKKWSDLPSDVRDLTGA
jgi:hypothetical protein